MIRPRLRSPAFAALLLLGLARVGPAQARQPAAPDVNALTHQMAERVRHLGEDIQSDLGQTPGGRHLVEDTQELAQAVDGFHESLHNQPNAFQVRQAYTGIDGTWHHLKSLLVRPENATPGVRQAMARVDQLDAQIHQALGLNDAPPGFSGVGPAPTGVADVRRLAHALVDRSQALAAVIPVDLAADPDAAAYSQLANDLAAASDRFHDTLDAGQDAEAARAAYNPVVAIITRLAGPLAAGPPRVRQTWQGVITVDAQIRRGLGGGAPQPAPPIAAVVDARPAPVQALADQLLGQTDQFLQGFAPIVNDHPANPAILADAQRLRAEADNFRQDVARGLDQGRLAYEYREVDATWQRMWRRIDRAARGRNGPNIERAREIGPICAQLHQALGMPGYSPNFPPPQRRRDDDDDR